jgi:hypothetical protein
MVAQLAEARLVDPGHEAAQRPLVGCDSDAVRRNTWMEAVRGVTGDVLIALPFWALVVFVVYLVLLAGVARL